MAVKRSFEFKTELNLTFLTGLKASCLSELRDGLKAAPSSSIYYHTHHFLKQNQFLTDAPYNDFAYWTGSVLKESRVSQKLAKIDAIRFDSMESLRAALLAPIDEFLSTQSSPERVTPGEEFHFLRCVGFDLPTRSKAENLNEFLEGLKQVSTESLYYHLFEGRLRGAHSSNDFAQWLRGIGYDSLAEAFERTEPYTRTFEELRQHLIRNVEQEIGEKSHVTAG